jgi:kinetochore protein NNF1
LKKCSYENFAECFPTTAQYAPGTLEYVHKQFVDGLAKKSTANFDHILNDRNVVPSLNQLDRLVNDAKVRKEAAEAAACPEGTASVPPA